MVWTEAWKLGSSLLANGIKLQETLMAAHHVVGHRSNTIAEAMRDPARADSAELGRMVAEKGIAFGQAGAAIAEDLLDIHADLLAQGWDMGLLLASGWPPDRRRVERIGRRASTLAIKLSTAGGRALKPVHATATANRRRLAKAKRGKS